MLIYFYFLKHKKVLAMSQLRSDILHKRKRKNIEKYERQYKRIHIAEPIQEYDENDENGEFTFNAFDTNDTEESDELGDAFTIIDKNGDDIFKNDNNGTNILNFEQFVTSM